jgi:hypothetical protein
MILHAMHFATLAMTLTLTSHALGATRAQTSTGSIVGVLKHPAHVVPAMRVCALLRTPTYKPYRCTTTRAGEDRYRIEGLPPGRYHVFAEAAEEGGHHRSGGHLDVLVCFRSPCPQPRPISVEVTRGATLRDIDITYFRDALKSFPVLPPD